MKSLTKEGQQHIADIAQRYNVSSEAVQGLLQAVVQGNGRMAQFNIPELGGNGQWMQGGMTMVGDMFNGSLKTTVSNLCQELSNLMGSSHHIFEKGEQHTAEKSNFSSHWWPAELGSPSSSGAQNNIRYAFFPPPVCRLAIEKDHQLSVYDTLDYHISGVSQQQGSGSSLSFSSQRGYVDISKLPLVTGERAKESGHEKKETAKDTSEMPIKEEKPTSHNPKVASADIFSKIEHLSELYEKGILTHAEFSTKKAELLERL